jgi:transcription antitermination factor NusG
MASTRKVVLGDELSWYAVSTRSRAEKIAAEMLHGLCIDNFLPLITEVRRWSDRNQVVSLPLFPCYLFVKIATSYHSQLCVLKVPGIVRFVGNQSGAQRIPNAEIEAIRTVLLHQVRFDPCSSPKAGDRVRVSRGVLAGIEGTLVSSGSKNELIISVSTIQQSITVRIDGSDVEPLPPLPSPDFVGMAPMLSDWNPSINRIQ